MNTGFLLPTAISAVAGGVDGVIAATDADSSRTEFIKQWSTYYQGALLLGGGVLGFAGIDPDFWEPMVFMGAGLLARRGGFAVVEAGQTTKVPAQGRTRNVPSNTPVLASYRKKQQPSVVG